MKRKERQEERNIEIFITAANTFLLDSIIFLAVKYFVIS